MTAGEALGKILVSDMLGHIVVVLSYMYFSKLGLMELSGKQVKFHWAVYIIVMSIFIIACVRYL